MAKELGILKGDVFCFSRESVERMADDAKQNVGELVDFYDGIPLGFNYPNDSGISLEEMQAVIINGETEKVVIIGPDPKTVRELRELPKS
jgi:hypothetical protein